MPRSVIKLHVGPVQDFIAQARSTRDLWSGSYLLTWLMASGIKRLAIEAGRDAMIYPNLAKQPLVDFHFDAGTLDLQKPEWVLTPNIPNILVAMVEGDFTAAAGLAKAVCSAIETSWAHIVEDSLAHLVEGKLINPDSAEDKRFREQAQRHLSIAWQVTVADADYRSAYNQCSWQLDAARQTRDFEGWREGGWLIAPSETKDSLSGKEESVVGGGAWWDARVRDHCDPRWRTLFRERRKSEALGAITLIKRIWHWAHLCKRHKLPTMHSGADCFPFPSTLHIASHDPAKNEDATELTIDAEEDRLERYFAVLAMDGDQIGQWVSGTKLTPAPEDFESYHRKFSLALSSFALDQVREVVEQHQGRLIYAGGDDVIAILPADNVIACAEALREAYRRAMHEFVGEGDVRPEMSGGIAIAHFKSPLQDVVRAAHAAEKRAKYSLGRSALAVSLLKRSGEIIEWGCEWESGGLRLYENLLKGLRPAGSNQSPGLSARFPHAFSELISAYLSPVQMTTSAEFEMAARDLLIADLKHVLRRQGEAWPAADKDQAVKSAQTYLGNLADGGATGPELATALDGLCSTLAFLHTSPDQGDDEPQPSLSE